MPLPKWGGVSLFVCSLHSERGSISSGFLSPFPALIVANFQTIGANFQQKGAKVRFYLVCFGVFSGKSETENGKNKDIFYFRGFRGAAFILFCGGGGRVHWVQVVLGAGASGPARCWRWSSGGALPAVWSLSRFALVGLLANMALFRILGAFLAGFICLVWVCIALVLCVACMAFVCVNS